MNQTIVNNLGETLLSRPIYNLEGITVECEIGHTYLDSLLKDILEADEQLRAIDKERKQMTKEEYHILIIYVLS